MHISKSEFQKYYIQYQVKYGVENSLDALEMVLVSNNSHI